MFIFNVKHYVKKTVNCDILSVIENLGQKFGWLRRRCQELYDVTFDFFRR